MIDAVLGYHMNPLTCGVAKFNAQLAERLGVPFRPWAHDGGAQCPLLSVKPSEVTAIGLWAKRWPTYDVFLHDWARPYEHHVVALLKDARTIYAGNAALADTVRIIRDDVVTAWCPSTVQGDWRRGTINVLTFGMAHKRVLPHFEKLNRLLDDSERDYTVSVSCGIHEGHSWSEAWAETDASMRAIFGDKLRVLGFLADDALARELRECTAVALFYDPALRANNTTFWAAVEAGAPIVTNLDDLSPRSSRALAADITDLSFWPQHLQLTWRAGQCRVEVEPYSWSTLIDWLKAPVPA